jgi:hypothetical protein
MEKKGLDDSLSEHGLQLVTHFHSVSIGSSERWSAVGGGGGVTTPPPALLLLPSSCFVLPLVFFSFLSFPSDCRWANRILIS